jgi:hypothetical protein
VVGREFGDHVWRIRRPDDPICDIDLRRHSALVFRAFTCPAPIKPLAQP